MRLADGVFDRIVPRLRIERDRPWRHEKPDVEYLRPADADLGHRLEVRRNAVLRHVPVHPVPPDVRTRRRRRIAESRRKISARRRARQARAGGRKDQRPETCCIHSDFHFVSSFSF